MCVFVCEGEKERGERGKKKKGREMCGKSQREESKQVRINDIRTSLSLLSSEVAAVAQSTL